jgi:hypothetical protein
VQKKLIFFALKPFKYDSNEAFIEIFGDLRNLCIFSPWLFSTQAYLIF